MRFKLTNPYDPALIDAQSPAVAVAATLVMGGGKFSVHDVQTGQEWPGAEGSESWFESETGLPPGAFLESNSTAVAAALETVQLEGPRTCVGVDVVGRARFFARGLKKPACVSEQSSHQESDGFEG